MAGKMECDKCGEPSGELTETAGEIGVCDDCLCPLCGGDGECGDCDGNGACYHCGGECPECDGSGDCPECHGNGYK